MATVVLKSIPVHTFGELPEVGTKAPNFQLVANDLTERTLKSYLGQNVILNVLHSVDTSTCSKSILELNEYAKTIGNVKILCISKDLPFAMRKFMTGKELNYIETLSDYRYSSFGKNYQIEFVDGPLKNLLSRCLIVLGKDGTIQYAEQVYENSDEPDYDSAFKALKQINE
ncbi:thiol peroxidase [Aegicerativicinus sediminis]|uniref:thiol peroxidase n=1 Tax=Aegicerativicinus sediminis TaxID=2893202 RepID=UPI001E641838|nr:thiol peroxidase [Aegicerativicinus sediminis]